MANTGSSIRHQAIRGGVILSIARVSSRSIDILRLLTIARWLGPKEIGAYAVTALVIGALDQLSETGLRQAIVQCSKPVDNLLPAVRGVQITRGLVLGTVVFMTAPTLAGFFNSPNSCSLLRAVSVVPVLRGLEPLFFAIAQRNLQFGYMVVIQLTASMLGLLVAIFVSIRHPNAWAMVFATLTTCLVNTLGAYLLTPSSSRRISFDWRPLREIHSFGFWIFATSVVSYVFLKGGDWLIGRVLDVESLAMYQMAFMVSTVATTEIGAVSSGICFPLFSRLKEDTGKLKSAYCEVFSVISISAFGIAGLTCCCAPELYHTVLGERWLSGVHLVPWLAAWGACSVLSSVIGKLLQATGKVRHWTYTVTAMGGVFLATAFPAVNWKGTVGIAALLCCIGLVTQFGRLRLVYNIVQIPIHILIAQIFVPITACLIGTLATVILASPGTTKSPLMNVMVSIIIFNVCYLGLVRLAYPLMGTSPFRIVKEIVMQWKPPV